METNTIILIALTVAWLFCWVACLAYVFGERSEVLVRDTGQIVALGILAPLALGMIVARGIAKWYDENKERALITLSHPKRKELSSEPERWK
jgi:predicted Na+-dependent transporter